MEKKHYIQPKTMMEGVVSTSIMQLVLGSPTAKEPGKQSNPAPARRTEVF